MENVRGVIAPQTLLLVIAALFLFGWGIAPTKASADSITSQTAQVLPTGGNACPQITASNPTSYVYSGALNSFEFTVSDSSYVAVGGSVGGSQVPFNLMTRWGAQDEGLKVHVDFDTPIRGTLPIMVTLLSSHGAGQPVCVTTVSMTVGSGPVQSIPSASASVPATTPVSTTYKPRTSGTPSKTSTGAVASSAGTMSTSGSMSVASSGVASAGASAVVSSIGSVFQKACSTPVTAERTWLILLLVYMLVVGLALWAEFPMSMPSMRTPERVAAIILVLLLLLLGFWYFSASCRTALWMPLVAVLIAVLGLLAAYRNHPRVTQLFLIQGEGSS